MGEYKLLSSIPLATTKNGKISVSRVEKPYGENSEAVVSIGISLKGEEPNWKVHIPYENIDELIEALKSAKNTK